MDTVRIVGVSLVAAVVLSIGGCTRNRMPAAPPVTAASPKLAPATERVVGPLSVADADALATMNVRLRDYVTLHRKLETSLPHRPDEATPEQIDQNQRAFEKLIRAARATSKPGDIFTPESRPVIRRLLATVFRDSDGRQLKSSIMDENPVDPATLRFVVNSRYPDTVPLTTVPPQVLQAMPQLTEDLEYRFLGDRLILLDTHAHVIADFIDHVLPK